MERKKLLGALKKIVIKVGTSTLAKEDGSLNIEKINRISGDKR